MAKTIRDLRTATLKVLEELSPDDPAFVEGWMKSFDEHHGLNQINAREEATDFRPAKRGNRRGQTR